ncbi:MAG: HD-GYP domain-containing protein [Thermodesulfobacteriota bacterium]
MPDDEMVEVTRSLEKYYKNYAIYMRPSDGKGYILYKPKGVPIEAVRIKEKRHPQKLYISLEDKIKEVCSFQRKYSAQLKKNIREDPVAAKTILHKTMEVSLAEPRTPVLHNLKETIDIVVSEYLENPAVVGNLIAVSTKDYSTAVHSVNVMLLCLGFGHYSRFPLTELKQMGLAGLLHDVGKVNVPDDILKASRELTVRETKLLRQHAEHGYRTLKDCGFDGKVALSALEHHERADGSGYPDGKTRRDLLPESAALSIIDTFEHRTGYRPDHPPLKPIEALAGIMEEVVDGKFDRELFKTFAHSVVGMQ